jgi:hypothetical protein
MHNFLVVYNSHCSDYGSIWRSWGGGVNYERELLSLWLYKENNKLRDWKNVFTLHIPPWAPHTYDFVVLTSLTFPRKILLVVLQIGKQEIRKAKELSAPLRMTLHCMTSKGWDMNDEFEKKWNEVVESNPGTISAVSWSD